MADHPRKKHFLNMPSYPGGTQAFREFISGNLQYPQAALDAGIEGSVMVAYDILDTGAVKNPHVLKGLGHGCDEEALRVVSMLQFEKVKNRGVRLKLTTKTNINFILPPGLRITYTQAVKKEPAEREEDKPVTYGYTIQL